METTFRQDFIRGIRIGTGIFATLAVGWAGVSFGAAAWGALPNAGTTLSSAAWNDIVSQVNTIAGAMKISGSNVGIGTTVAPSAARLEILHTSGNQLNPTLSMRSTLNGNANLSHYMNLAAGQTNPSVLNGDQALIFTNDASATSYSSYGLVIGAWSDK